MLRILVTGGAGFQGSHLAEHWASMGHQVTILNTFSEQSLANVASLVDQVSVVWGSVTDREIVEKTVRGQDVVVHMAAWINVDESIADPRSVLDVNVTGTYNVLEAVRRLGTRLIFASSCEVYGGGDRGAVSEAAEFRPYSPYAASKAAADRLCFAYWRSYGLDVSVIRPCNIYGPRQRGGKGGAVIPRFVDQALAGSSLIVYGTGEQSREFMHVSDLVAAYDLVLRRDDLQGQAINFGTGELPEIKEIAQRIGEYFSVSVHFGPGRPGEVDRFELNSNRAQKIGFVPQVQFWEGLRSYLDWRSRVSEHNRG